MVARSHDGNGGGDGDSARVRASGAEKRGPESWLIISCEAQIAAAV
jgi:hypothetical protein